MQRREEILFILKTPFSNGSRISQRGAPTTEGGANLLFGQFSRQLHKNEDILGGGPASIAPPRFATIINPSYSVNICFCFQGINMLWRDCDGPSDTAVTKLYKGWLQLHNVIMWGIHTADGGSHQAAVVTRPTVWTLTLVALVGVLVASVLTTQSQLVPTEVCETSTRNTYGCESTGYR